MGSPGICQPHAGGYARDRRTVGIAVGTGLVNRVRREFLGHGLAGKRRVVQIDAGVDEADGHPGAGLGVLTLEQGDVAVGGIRIDVLQPPLVPEAVNRPVRVLKLRRRLRERLPRYAVSIVYRDALRRCDTPTAADDATAAKRERQGKDDETNEC